MPPKAVAPRKSLLTKTALPTVTLIGHGNWGTALASALDAAGVRLSEIIVRKSARHSIKLNARQALLAQAKLDADVLWICTPDAAIVNVADQLVDAFARRSRHSKPIVFHSSGALASSELSALRSVGASIASVHPLMTFPRRSSAASRNQLAGVSFAIEGDARACRAARKLVRAMGGQAFSLPAESKPLYHAFGAYASPMLVALLTAAVETAIAAGFTPVQARRRMRPIVERTVSNFFTAGPGKSFSGPIARGDAATVARHLEALQTQPGLHAIYAELTRFALDKLPTRNQKQIRQLLDAPPEESTE